MANVIPASNWASSELQSIVALDQLDKVTELVQRSSELALDWYRAFDRAPATADSDFAIENKSSGGFDPVTEADRAVESKIRAGLAELFPDHSILGEEFGTTGNGDIQWIIDPIDGTRAFITGQPMWGTIVAVTYQGRPLAGWMHVPTLDETYIGSEQTWWSAKTDFRQINTMATTDLADAVMLCTHPSMFSPGAQAESFARLDESVKMTRYSGDCVNYGLLAMGLADLVVENQLAPYDILPMLPIVEGAGGIVTDLDGQSPLTGGYVVAAANDELHAAALDLLR